MPFSSFPAFSPSPLLFPCEMHFMMIRHYKPGDEERIVALLNSCFGANASPEDYAHATEIDSGFNPSKIWVAEEAGKIVGHVMSVRRQVNLGENFVNVAGIAAVCTDKDYRGKGVASSLMEAALSELDESVAMLYTDYGSTAHRIYRRSGFSPLYFFGRYTGESWDMSSLLKRLKTTMHLETAKQFGLQDAPTLMGAYDEVSKITSFAVRRDEKYWQEKLLKRNFWHTFSYKEFNPSDVLVVPHKGYAYLDKEGDSLFIREVVARDDSTETVTSLIATAFQEREAKTFYITLPEPPPEPLVAGLYRMIHGELLVSILKPAQLIRELWPEGTSMPFKFTIRLRLFNDVKELEPVTIGEVKPGGDLVEMALHQTTLVRLLAGIDDPVRDFLDGLLEIKGDAHLVLNALSIIPRRKAMMWPTDRWRRLAAWTRTCALSFYATALIFHGIRSSRQFRFESI
ncbi:GNAT family N-acetyltransferase [Tardisphaera miroshnichenkoae]